MLASRKANIMLCRIQLSLMLTNAVIITNLLDDQLSISATLKCCTRLELSNRPSRLLTMLSFDTDIGNAIPSASMLRRSSDAYINVHVSLMPILCLISKSRITSFVQNSSYVTPRVNLILSYAMEQSKHTHCSVLPTSVTRFPDFQLILSKAY